jgi:hypothetical protein
MRVWLFIIPVLVGCGLFRSQACAEDVLEPTETRSIGPYQIEIFGEPDLTMHKKQVLRISRDGQVLASVEDYYLSIEPGRIQVSDDQFTPPKFGENVTGDGLPDLVVYAFNGNAYLFPTLHIYELGPKLRKIFSLDEYVYGFKKTDQGADWKIFLGDQAALMQWGHVWYGIQVIMAFDNDAQEYRLAASLMRKPAPSRQDLDRMADEIRKDDAWEYVAGSRQMTIAILELIYGGNGSHVDQLLDRAWNQKFPGQAEFRAELIDCYLRRSSWWNDIARLNGWPALKPACSPSSSRSSNQ